MFIQAVNFYVCSEVSKLAKVVGCYVHQTPFFLLLFYDFIIQKDKKWIRSRPVTQDFAGTIILVWVISSDNSSFMLTF